MLRVHRVKAEGPGLSSMSSDRRTNKRKKLRKRREREQENNKAAAKVAVEAGVLLAGSKPMV